MTYTEAIRFLYGLQMFGAKPGLERTLKLAALAGNPEQRLRFIHVAGTNGKGSTCALLESIYRAAGLRVGLFTSPHLVSFRERIQINRQLISETEVARLAAEQIEFLKTFPTDDHPTMFEVVTVMALSYFAEQKCDLVILETGLGGRLDATNLVTPLASVITAISFDHEQWLGDTLTSIAGEKAGIIKPSIPVITSAAQPAVLDVIAATAHRLSAPLTCMSPDATATLPVELPFLGNHQKQNAALAAATVAALQGVLPVPPAALQTGLRAASWPGRMQLIARPTGQRILLDGAHNQAGVTALLETLRSNFAADKPTLIIGILNDKSWREMAAQFANVAARVLTVPVASGRAVTSEELATAFREHLPDAATACPSLADALSRAESDPFVVITGSLYLVGEALELLGLGPAGTEGERGLNEWKPAGSR